MYSGPDMTWNITGSTCDQNSFACLGDCTNNNYIQRVCYPCNLTCSKLSYKMYVIDRITGI